jgi:hypothetical protein
MTIVNFLALLRNREERKYKTMMLRMKGIFIYTKGKTI